jgi:hypothetical protein
MRYGNCMYADGFCTKTTHQCNMYVTADFQRTFHTHLHNEQGHILRSYDSCTKDKKISAEQTRCSHSKKKNYLKTKVMQVLPKLHAKLCDIMQGVLFRKFCINMHWIINCYAAVSILMYMYSCNPQFYSTYALSHCKKNWCTIIIKEIYQSSNCCLLDHLIISLYTIRAMLWSLIFAGSPCPSCDAITSCSPGEWDLVTSWAKAVDQNNQSSKYDNGDYSILLSTNVPHTSC